MLTNAPFNIISNIMLIIKNYCDLKEVLNKVAHLSRSKYFAIYRVHFRIYKRVYFCIIYHERNVKNV